MKARKAKARGAQTPVARPPIPQVMIGGEVNPANPKRPKLAELLVRVEYERARARQWETMYENTTEGRLGAMSESLDAVLRELDDIKDRI